MRKVGILILVCVLIGGGYLAYTLKKAHALSSLAQEEGTTQVSEVQECRRRLALFYKAWASYKADHKGAEPPTIESLIPKYIPDPKLLVCPTAERWMKKGALMEQGVITIDRHNYPETYGFIWLAPSRNAVSLKRYGEAAPLIICASHQEGLYRATYKKRLPLGAFDEDQRTKWVPEVGTARTLAVRRNGKVEELVPGTED